VNFIKEHPFLTGLGVIAVAILYFVLRGSGSSSASTSAAPQTDDALEEANIAAQLQQYQIQTANQANTNQLNAGLEAAQLQAAIEAAQVQGAVQVQTGQTQGAVSIAGIQGNVQMNSDDDQLQAIANTNAAQTSQAQIAAELQSQEAGDQLNAILGSTQLQVGGAEDIAGIQAGVSDLQSNNALAAQKDVDSASIQMNGQNTNVAIQQALDALTLGTTQANDTAQTNTQYIAAQLAGLENNNATATLLNSQNVNGAETIDQIIAGNNVDLANISAGVSTAQINADEDVTNNYLNGVNAANNAAATQSAQELQDQNNLYASIENLVSSGALNKGGEGGAAQLAAIAALLGQPSVVAPVAQVGTAQAQSNPLTAFFNSLGSAVGTVGKAATSFFNPLSIFGSGGFTGGTVQGVNPATAPAPSIGNPGPIAGPPSVGPNPNPSSPIFYFPGVG
jgi:hypothetical protein